MSSGDDERRQRDPAEYQLFFKREGRTVLKVFVFAILVAFVSGFMESSGNELETEVSVAAFLIAMTAFAISCIRMFLRLRSWKRIHPNET